MLCVIAPLINVVIGIDILFVNFAASVTAFLLKNRKANLCLNFPALGAFNVCRQLGPTPVELIFVTFYVTFSTFNAMNAMSIYRGTLGTFLNNPEINFDTFLTF